MKHRLMKADGRNHEQAMSQRRRRRGGLAIAMLAIAAFAPASAQPQPTGPVLHCYVSPNNLPMPPGDLGRCTTTFSSPSGYTADFEIRNLPAGSYSFSWTSDLGVALTCTTHRCRQHYRGDMPVADVINVTYTDLVTGEARTLTRFVRFNGRI